MTIEVYASLVAEEADEIHDWNGTVGAFMAANGIDFKARIEQPVVVIVDGHYVSSTLWSTTDCRGKSVQLRVVAHGFDPFTWAIIAVVAAVGVSLLMRPKIPGQNSTPQGKNLTSAEATGNVAKLNDVVPEIAGRHLRYPDYLTPPRRYFADKRTQYLETLLCIGPGSYAIDGNSVKIGNTPLVGLPGAEFHIYEQSADVSVHGMHWNWYSAPEVGGTSAGTAGLELSSDVISDIQTPAGTLTFGGKTITASDGWPQGIGVGSQIALRIPMTYTASTVTEGSGEESYIVSEFTGDFSELMPLTVGKAISFVDGNAAPIAVTVRSTTNVGGVLKVRFNVTTGSGEDATTSRLIVAPGTRTMSFQPTGRRYRVSAMTDNVITLVAQRITGWNNTSWIDDTTWVSFPSTSTAAAATGIALVGGNVYGKWSGPFVNVPPGEASNAIEIDFFFPSGLSRISDGGDLEARGVSLELQYRQVGTTTWASLSKSYAEATLDQIGFTERINMPAIARWEFRARRTTAAGADTQVNDKVQWYGYRSLLQSPAAYDGWTTIAMRIKGLGDISTSSENRLNLIATRILPVMQVNGTYGGFQPTRDISAFFRHIVHSVGYTDAQIDLFEMRRIHDIWTARGETVDHVFDATTVRNALEVCVGAGMADLTLADGLLTPVLEGVRTTFDGPGFSSQNVTGDIRRSFATRRPDDNDGIQVEYIDADDNYTKKTVDCKLPTSIGAKLKKYSATGVTSKVRAWRIGMRMAREIVYRRWSYSLETELDGLVARYGDYVPIIPDIPDFGQSAIITAVVGRRVTSSEPLRWVDGATHVAAWRNQDGSVAGPFAAAKVSEFEFTVPNGTQMPTTNLSMEPPHLYFGTAQEWCEPAIIRAVQPQGELRVQIQATNYDARIYADDNQQPEY